MSRAASERVYLRSLVLEDTLAVANCGRHSQVGKILEIHQAIPGRIHAVLVRPPADF